MLTKIDNCSYNTKHQAAAKKLGEHGKPLFKPEKTELSYVVPKMLLMLPYSGLAEIAVAMTCR